MLGKLPVPGRPTSLDDSKASAYCACSRCGRGFVWTPSLINLFSFLSTSLWETARYTMKYCLKGPLNPKQPTTIKGMSNRKKPTNQQAVAVSIALYRVITLCSIYIPPSSRGMWSGGAMMLGKLPVPWRPTNFDYSRARAYCAFRRCGCGLFGHFYPRL